MLALVGLVVFSSLSLAQSRSASLESRLLREDVTQLAKAARGQGDPVRGAVLFHQPQLGCTKCHSAGDSPSPLGPDLSKPEPNVSDVYLIESVLLPSKVIRKGYATETITRIDGKSISGLVAEDRGKEIVVRDPRNLDKPIVITKADIEDRRVEKTSLMPAGLVNLLPDRQQFLDLASYLFEIAEFGPARARSLRPDPATINPPLPEYEKDLDHAGLIAELDEPARKRGEAIYGQLCITCHGTRTQPGSMPTSLPFAVGKFKNGNDPYAMYQTLTRGYGLMPRQPSLVPRQKYDVIHYIRESYLKPFNKSQYFKVDRGYLDRLPKGTSRGPKPAPGQPWINADYGRTMMATIEVGNGGGNIAYKGIAVRLDPGAGGVAKGKAWMLYEHDTMRVAAAWTGDGFIDWNGINFNGQHQVHPRAVGHVAFETAPMPGWADPATGKFDDPRLKGLDGKPYGPLPRKWAAFRGLYRHGDRAILSYTVGSTPVLESPGMAGRPSSPVFTRSFQIEPHDRDLFLQVAATPKMDSGRSFRNETNYDCPGHRSNRIPRSDQPRCRIAK